MHTNTNPYVSYTHKHNKEHFYALTYIYRYISSPRNTTDLLEHHGNAEIAKTKWLFLHWKPVKFVVSACKKLIYPIFLAQSPYFFKKHQPYELFSMLQIGQMVLLGMQ